MQVERRPFDIWCPLRLETSASEVYFFILCQYNIRTHLEFISHLNDVALCSEVT